MLTVCSLYMYLYFIMHKYYYVNLNKYNIVYIEIENNFPYIIDIYVEVEYSLKTFCTSEKSLVPFVHLSTVGITAGKF